MSDFTGMHLFLEQDVIKELKRKYDSEDLQEIVNQIIHEDVCVRAYNICEECGKGIYIFLIKPKFHEAARFEAAKNTMCNVCKPGSRWKRNP